MFKGVSQCMPTECALLCSVQSLRILSLTLLTTNPHFSTVFNTHPYIFYLHILWYAILLMLYYSLFPSLLPRVPKSSSSVTNKFYNWVCIWSCLFWFTRLPLDLSSMCDRKHASFVYLILAWYPPIASIYLQTSCHYSLWLCSTPLWICITISWSIHSCRTSELFPELGYCI
jgi:hypothetical protein